MEKNRDPRLVKFGKRVATARATAGLTQAQLTEAMALAGAPVPATAVAKIETGARPTSVIELVALSNVLGVDAAELAGTRAPDPEQDNRGEKSRRELALLRVLVDARDALQRATVAYRAAYAHWNTAAHENIAHGGYRPEFADIPLPSDPTAIVRAEVDRWPYVSPAGEPFTDEQRC